MNFEDLFGDPTPYGRGPAEGADAFRELDATSLYCPRCREAVPVRKHLLLVLPDGDKYEYRCAYCAESVGMKIDRKPPMPLIV